MPRLVSLLLKLLLVAALTGVGGPARTVSPPVADPAAAREQLADEIDTLRSRVATAGASDASAQPLRSELTLLERLDSLLARQQALVENQSRLARAETAMREKLAAGPEGDVADNPPYPLALLDILGDAVDALERQRAVLESAADAAKTSLEAARGDAEEADRERRKRVEDLDRATSAIDRARAETALRLAELRVRVGATRSEIAELELDAARRDLTLHQQNLAITRAVLFYVERELDLGPDLRAEMQRAAEQRSREIQRERERANLDLERAQARRLAAEKRRDEQEQPTAAALAENEALAARQETLQLRVASLGQQEERLGSVATLRDRRYQTLAGEAGRPEMREWELELRNLAADLERRRQVEEGRAAQVRALREQLEARTAALDPEDPQHRWALEHRSALDERLAIHAQEIADLASVRTQALRFQDELGRRTAHMSFGDRFEILQRKLASLWETEIASLDDRPITLGKIATAFLVLILGLLASRLLSRGIGRFTSRRTSLDAGAAAAFQSLSYYTLIVVFLLVALRSANIPLTVFTILGGAFAIGVGFGSQNIIANFISGLILLVERPIKVNDMIEVDGTLGLVEGIGLRATRVRTFDNIHIVVPNSAFLERNVVNWNLRDDTVRGQVNVGVAYGSPTREVERLLLQAADEQPLVLEQPAPTVLFLEFGDNALAFRLYFWVEARNVLDRIRVESNLRYRIDDLFRESEVVIAFPQRDVHLDTSSPLQLEWRRSDDEPR